MKTTRNEKIVKPGVYDDDDTLYTEDQLKAAVAAEREACAKVAEAWGVWVGDGQLVATAIRTRGDKK